MNLLKFVSNMRFRTAKLIALPLIAAPILSGISAVHGGIFSGGKTTRVFVDSVASDEYQKRENKDEPETYHFFKGRYFGGNIADRSLDRVSFQDVVDTLAKDMKNKNYFPEEDTQKGDLFIVVHWGVTSVEEDWNDLMAITDFGTGDTGTDDFGDTSDAGAFDNSSSGDDFIYSQPNQSQSATLLGYDRALRGNLSSQEEYELRDDLKDERYFIILMAYDHQTLLKEKTLKFLWSTRFSLRGIGTNFEDAYLALSRGATPYFGEHLKTGSRVRTHLGQGDIDFGDLEILEVAPQTTE